MNTLRQSLKVQSVRRQNAIPAQPGPTIPTMAFFFPGRTSYIAAAFSHWSVGEAWERFTARMILSLVSRLPEISPARFGQRAQATGVLSLKGSAHSTDQSPQRVQGVGNRRVRGRQFLSMEYIDGEDLSSLLRWIGRLPPAKVCR